MHRQRSAGGDLRDERAGAGRSPAEEGIAPDVARGSLEGFPQFPPERRDGVFVREPVDDQHAVAPKDRQHVLNGRVRTDVNDVRHCFFQERLTHVVYPVWPVRR